MSAADRATRDRMIVEAMRTGLCRADAAVLTDMSKHAFTEAMGTAQRVLDTCPPQLRLAAFASVVASFASVMREQLPEHWAAFIAAGDQTADAVIVLPEAKP